MNYELARELKDAEFPQDGHGELHSEIPANELKFDKSGHSIIPEKYVVYYPTLSELIEACGEYFGELAKVGKDDWCVCEISFVYPENKEWIAGKTPEEAVAKLWLALNKK